MKDILYIAYCKYQHCRVYMYKLSKKCWLESDQVEEYWCSPKCPNVFVYVTISGEPISSGPPFSKKGKICKFGGTLGYFYKFSSHSILPKSDFFKSAFVLQCEKNAIPFHGKITVGYIAFSDLCDINIATYRKTCSLKETTFRIKETAIIKPNKVREISNCNFPLNAVEYIYWSNSVFCCDYHGHWPVANVQWGFTPKDAFSPNP